MKFTTLGMRAAVSLALCLALSAVGCDASKEELEKTRGERDQLKSQLATAQASLDATKKELADAKAQAVKCAPAAAPAAAAPAAAAPAAAEKSKAPAKH